MIRFDCKHIEIVCDFVVSTFIEIFQIPGV